MIEIITTCSTDGIDNVTYDEEFWDVKPKLMTWTEVCQQLTTLKARKIQEGKVRGPYGQELKGKLTEKVPSHNRTQQYLTNPPPCGLSTVNSPSFIPGALSATAMFEAQLESKDVDELATMELRSDTMGAETLLAIAKRIQSLLLQKTIEVSQC